MLGGASGAVAGLVAVTPAAGVSGPVGAMLLGGLASLVCYGFVGSLKNRLRLDDSLDVFGIHGLGGIVGSIGTALVALPALGGHGGAGYAPGASARWCRLPRWRWRSPVGARVRRRASRSVRRLLPLRYGREARARRPDLSDHGERAYNY